jgi:hypothetical protein
MDRGLRAPLSVKEEIALRRVASGIGEVGAPQVERLLQLDLVQHHRATLRLTETGVRRLGILAASLETGAAARRQP